jgi:hypothetical protein
MMNPGRKKVMPSPKVLPQAKDPARYSKKHRGMFYNGKERE